MGLKRLLPGLLAWLLNLLGAIFLGVFELLIQL